MMKLKLLSYVSLLALVYSASTWADDAAPNKLEYKCYLNTTLGYKIAFYKWDVKNKQRNIARLPAKKVPYSSPGKRAYIKEVEECVELDATFSNGLARSLDEITAR
ncbi:TapY2 family type IVa secretion system protein [Shewanella benthica]|uniref:Uncharacterized protein n=1 Tax=Shewanella benthica KT99 TaxID=314608 RepID=A9DAX0_9GAMM|nr:TapY2 family type IVa secretion system protein [Shewanella benthica]EDQ00656.1 hypothetical protein KT99_03884 [Shewanella benthica KT99]